MNSLALTQARDRLVLLGRSLFDRGLTPGSSGNLSMRVDDLIVITPTGHSLGRLDPADLAVVSSDGRVVSGGTPSKELPLHLLIYRARACTRGVAHLHSTHAVAASCLTTLDASCALPILTPYFAMQAGPLGLVPYHPPGSAELVAAAEETARRHRALLLANHGPLVGAGSIDAAVNAIEEIEEAAKLFWLLRNLPARALSASEIATLEAQIPG